MHQIWHSETPTSYEENLKNADGWKLPEASGKLSWGADLSPFLCRELRESRNMNTIALAFSLVNLLTRLEWSSNQHRNRKTLGNSRETASHLPLHKGEQSPAVLLSCLKLLLAWSTSTWTCQLPLQRVSGKSALEVWPYFGNWFDDGLLPWLDINKLVWIGLSTTMVHLASLMVNDMHSIALNKVD